MESDHGKINLMKCVDFARRWLWLVVAGTLIAGGVALAVSLVLPLTYEAEADVASVKSLSLISLSPDSKVLSDTQLTQGLNLAARLQTLVAIALGNDVASGVIAQLGPALSPGERQIARLLEMVKVSSSGDLIQIRIQSKEPNKAALVANAWANVFATRVNQLYTETPANLDQLQGQVDQAWQAYQKAQAAFNQFTGANQIETLSRQIAAKENTVSDLLAVQRNLDRLLQDGQLLQDLAGKDPSLSSDDAGNRLALLLIRANAAMLSYSAQSGAQSSNQSAPLQLQVTANSVTDATPGIRAQIDAVVTSLQAQRKQVAAKLSNPGLQQQILALQKELESQNAKKLELDSARDLAWSTYKILATKVEEVKIAQQSGGTIVRPAGRAVVPTEPCAPRKVTNTLIAAFIGFLLSLGVAFGKEIVDSNIRSESEVDRHLR